MRYIATTALAAALFLSGCSGADDSPDESGDPVADTPEPSVSASTETAEYDGPIPLPIMVGSDGPTMDACGTYGEVANLDAQSDNYLSVRDAPSTATKERDRLDAGQSLSVCASRDGWLGVVYSKTGEDCEVSSPVDSEQRYLGPCAQGWVDARFVEMIAG